MWSYTGYTDIAGPLTVPADGDPTVKYRRLLTSRQRLHLGMLVILNAVVSFGFLGWLLRPSHLPISGGGAIGAQVLAVTAYVLLILMEIVRVTQNSSVWAFAAQMQDPQPMAPVSGLRIAVLTTIVPSKEPIDVVVETLKAMRQIEYDGVVDVWILDEGDDPAMKRWARRLGVHHFSRKGRPEYNQPSGPYRSKTKAGNHNAWRAEHEWHYDVIAQMDPDHRPHSDFLTRTLGYFRDPDVAFVVAPQVYGNADESFVACAAADQAYMFHGVIQRGASGLEAPLLIGTNHVYRPEAWRQVGGYQDSVIEDHLTSLRVHASVNPATGRPWKGVYTPDILAIGEGPTTWTDYFNQQRRWAHGVWDVVLNHSRGLFPHLSGRQRLSYAALQYFYPSIGLIWVLGGTVTALYLLLGVNAIFLDTVQWATLWASTVLAQLALVSWLRQFNLADHEREGIGAKGQLLSLFAGPVYVAAGAAALCRRTLRYVVTAKGALMTRDSWETFRLHLRWMACISVALLASGMTGHSYWVLRLWAVFTVAAVSIPVLMFWYEGRRQQRLLWASRGRRLTNGYFAPIWATTAAAPRVQPALARSSPALMRARASA